MGLQNTGSGYYAILEELDALGRTDQDDIRRAQVKALVAIAEELARLNENLEALVEDNDEH